MQHILAKYVVCLLQGFPVWCFVLAETQERKSMLSVMAIGSPEGFGESGGANVPEKWHGMPSRTAGSCYWPCELVC